MERSRRDFLKQAVAGSAAMVIPGYAQAQTQATRAKAHHRTPTAGADTSAAAPEP